MKLNELKKYATKKNILIAGTAAGALVLFFAVKTLVNYLKPPVIAFYGIEKTVQQNIQSEVKKYLDAEGIIFSFKTLNAADTLERQLKKSPKPALVFAPQGESLSAAVKAASQKAAFNNDLILDMTSSAKRAAPLTPKKNSVQALPVLLDHLEIALDLIACRASDMDEISTWDHLEQFHKITELPMIFAGKDSNVLLDLLGALTEAFDGVAQYEQAGKILASAANGHFDAVKTAKDLAGTYNSPLYSALAFLKKNYKDGVLHTNVFSFTDSDISVFLKNRAAASVIMPLSTHRSLDNRMMARYSAHFLPSKRPATTRVFTGPVIFAVPLKKSSGMSKLMIALSTDKVQEALSKSTGLAPANAHCRIPDKEADDVRYWIAATSTPLAGLSREAALTKKQKDALAAELVTLIKASK